MISKVKRGAGEEHALVTRGEAAKRVSTIALGLTAGSIEVGYGDAIADLNPGSPLRLRIRGEESKSEGRLVIEMVWTPPLKITGAV